MDKINPTTGRICLACVALLAAIAVVWGWDCYRLWTRRPRRAEPCEEDKALDRLAEAVDRHLTTPPKRPTGPANRFDRQGIFHR